MQYFEEEDILHAKEVYGENMIDSILKEEEQIIQSIHILQSYKIDFYSEIFGRYPYLFTMSKKEWQQRIQWLIEKYGVLYKDALEEDLSILEEFL